MTLALTMTAGAAQAHPGHLADLAGHDHWVAGAAIAIAILTGIYGAMKGKTEAEADEAEDGAQEEAAA